MDRKTCLITGASSGIGESLARLLIKDGWLVVGIARRTEKLEKLNNHHLQGEGLNFNQFEIDRYHEVARLPG